MKINWNELKKINEKGLIGYFVPDYKINKTLFRVLLVFVLLLGVYTLYLEDWDFENSIYIKCPEKSMTACDNPFYYKNYELAGFGLDKCPDSELCRIEKFYPGETYGKERGWLYHNYEMIVFVLFLLALLFNHYKYNKNFDWNKYQTGVDEDDENSH